MAYTYVPYNGPIVTRSEAKASGLKLYFTGVACHAGHILPRYTKGGGCLQCCRDALTARRRANGVPLKCKQSNEQFLAKRRVLNIAWKSRNREVLAEKARAYYAANREECNERNKARQKEDRIGTLCRARSAKYRRKGAEGRHTKADILRLFDLQKGRCAGCRCSLKSGYDVDHIIALARGGSHWPSNLQLLCKPCNRSKSAADPITWAQRNGRLL